VSEERDTHMQNMLKYLMRLRLHVSVLVPLSDPRAKEKASERQGKARRVICFTLLARFMSHPAATSSFTASVCPQRAAMKIGVHPSWGCVGWCGVSALTSA
jgi:hypothetical protein